MIHTGLSKKTKERRKKKMIHFRQTLAFDDVLLEPKYSDIETRSSVDLSSVLGGKKYSLPVISSPMDTVTGGHLALAMAQNGCLGVIHRYNSILEQAEQLAISKFSGACAIGATGDYFERAVHLALDGCKILCIDVAHGHHKAVQQAIKSIKKRLSNVHVMAGNVATLHAARELAYWGADSIRLGIGCGCFIPGTLVNTENGLKKIEDIEVGDKVFSHTGKLQPVIDTLTFDRDEEIISINDIDCTKNHEFYVIEKKDASNVNEDNIHTFAKWIHAEELNMEKHLLVELE